MDDVDAVQAQISHNMIQSGNWVTPRLDGVKYLEKPPLKYWLIAGCFEIFGVHDWAARIPISLAAILLCWLTARMAGRALGADAGLYAGLALATSVGLWLFTRVLIGDVILTLAVALSIWGFFRATEAGATEKEAHWRGWALSAWASAAAAVMVKGLIGAVFPFGAIAAYLAASGLWRRETWRRLWIVPGLLVFLAIAAPWHVLATLRNPPYFDFTMHSAPGVYRGFFWFYFFNEHILRFLNLRYPHDYNTVPRWLFWMLHLVWFFPWSAFLIRAVRVRGEDRAARLRLLSVCWIGFVLLFFTLSTTQEYYSMPAYPAFAILIGGAMAESGGRAWKYSTRAVAFIAALAFVAIAGLLIASWSYAAPGDISNGLAHNTSDYTLSLDHMGDLTIRSFGWLRLPLVLAGGAMLTGAVGGWFLRGRQAALALALMMVLFFQAARLALIAFDPYLGSETLAEALNRAPSGGLIVNDPYYELSTIFFYANRTGLMLNGRINNLEYGSNAPGAPDVFIDDAGFSTRWSSGARWYMVTEDDKAEHLRDLVGADALHAVAKAGGKTVYTNQ